MVENTKKVDITPEYVIASMSVDFGDKTHTLKLLRKKANWFGLRGLYEKWSEKL